MPRLATLHEIALSLSGELHRGRLYDGLTRGAARLCGATSAVSYSCDPAGENLAVEASVGEAPPPPACVARALSERTTIVAEGGAATPLLCQGTLLGALYVAAPLTTDDLTMLQTLAVAVAAALTYAEAIANTVRRQAQGEALLAAYRSVAEAKDRDTILWRTLDTLTTVLGADRAACYLLDRRQTVGFAAARRVSRAYLETACRNMPRTAGGLAIVARAPIYVPDVSTDPRTRPLHALAAAEGIRTALIVPLLHRDDILGGLVLYHDIVLSHAPDDLALVRGFADHVALAVANARNTQRLERQVEVARMLSTIGRSVAESRNETERLQRAVQAPVAGGLAVQAWVFRADGTLAAQAGMSAFPREVAARVAKAALRGRVVEDQLAGAPVAFRDELHGALVLAAPPRPAPAPVHPHTITVTLDDDDDPEERLVLAHGVAERLGALLGLTRGSDAALREAK